MTRFTPALCLAASIFAAFVFAAPVLAQKVDLSTITCKDFFEGPQERVSYVVMWLDGYYANEDDPPLVDFDRMKKRVEELATFCAKNPTHGLITAADEVLGK
jgi:acid stress chaperone HdeB